MVFTNNVVGSRDALAVVRFGGVVVCVKLVLDRVVGNGVFPALAVAANEFNMGTVTVRTSSEVESLETYECFFAGVEDLVFEAAKIVCAQVNV